MARRLDRIGAFRRRDQFGSSALNDFQLRLLRCLQEWEDEKTIIQEEDRFQKLILAASMGPIDPFLYWKLFDPENLPSPVLDEGAVEYPTTEEGFARMISEWENADRQLEAQGYERPFFQT